MDWLRSPAVWAAGLIAVVGGACFVEGFEQQQAAGGSTSTGGSGTGTATGVGGGGGGSTGCEHAQWPGPPSQSDPGSDDLDIVVVARSINFGETDISNGPLVGYDLDATCTCQGEDASCRDPDWELAERCDGPAGRDNAIALLFNELSVYDKDFSSAEYTGRAEAGQDSLLLRVRNYNGQPNDDQVTVSIHPSQGIDDDPCNPPGTSPLWDGNDVWSINASSLEAGQGGAGQGGAGQGGAGQGGSSCGPGGWDIDAARFVDPNAYVSGSRVVANLPEVALQVTSGDDVIPVQLTAGFVSGRLELLDGDWYLREGLIVGRWSLAEFFKMIGSITSQQEPLCTDHVLYPLLRGILCKYPDITATLTGPTTPCDALSAGMAVEGYPAVIGSVLPLFEAQRLCPPETDPLFDSCAVTP